jgi:hypothetical protein
MKSFLIAIFSVGCCFASHAQIDREEPVVTSGPKIQVAQQRILGKVLDEKTNKGLEAASVQLFIFANGKDSLIRGMFTKGNGDFSFDQLPQADSFRIEISGIGYKQWS